MPTHSPFLFFFFSSQKPLESHWIFWGFFSVPLFFSNPFPEGSIQDVTLGSSYSYYMIQGLEPGTELTVTVNPIFGDIEGPLVTGKATTGGCPAANTELVSLLSLLGCGELFELLDGAG